MIAKHLSASILLTLVLAGAAHAQNSSLYQSEDEAGRPRPPLSHPLHPLRKHAAATAPASDVPAPAADAAPRDPVSAAMGDVAGILNAVFGVRDKPDDASALPRE